MVMPILSVSDLQRSLAFYTEELGWTKVFAMPGPSGDDVFAGVCMNEQVMFGLSANDAPAPKGQGVVFMCYVDEDIDIDQYYAECQERGAVVAQEIKDEYWGDRCFAVKDPDGYWLQVSKTVRDLTPEEIMEAAR